MKLLYTAHLHRHKFNIFFSFFLCFSVHFVRAQTEITTAKQYLKSNAQVQKLVDADIDGMTVSSAYLSPTTGWYHVYFNQNYQSVEVYNSMINMVLQQNQVQHTVGNFIPNIASKANTSNVKNITLSPLQALQRATLHLNLTASNFSEIKEISTTTLLDGTTNKATFSDAGISDENIEVKLYWLPTEVQNGEKTILSVKLSWNVKVLTKDKQNSWSVHVDALSGDILRQNDEVIHCNFGTPNHTKDPHVCLNEAISTENKKVLAANNYNVFDIPLESPNHGVRTLVSSPYTRFVPSGTGPGTTNGWHNDGTVDYTTTRGNNVYAKEDVANSNGTGASPTSPILEFDHPYTFGVSTATGNQNAAITNLFYWNNLIHDILWKFGFDEPSGNFQNNNQGRGGAGNDFVYADAQDGGGSNNANFSTPTDGGNGRMQMYLWSNAGTTPYQPDGDFDNGIIAHEYGHGWSIRLTGGPANSSCLQNGEQGGEGWSDYAALMFGTNWASLTPSLASANIPRGIGTYALGQPITGAGIRPFRYSYDKANINNVVTYAKVGDTGFSQPHGIGSIWATMLWDMTWEIILQDNIIVSNIYDTPTAVSNMRGNVAALKLVNEGLRLQPCSPSFIDARNAILSADQMLFGGRYRCAISRAFSRRGLGLNASTGTSSNDRTVTEDFTPITGNGLSSSTSLSVCSGNPFNYTATSSTVGTTFTWTRPAVAGISNVARTGNNASVTDTLRNTTNSAITVIYYFTLTPDLCGGVPVPQAVSVVVNPTVVPTVGNYTVCQNGTVPSGAGLVVPEIKSNVVNDALTISSPSYIRSGASTSPFYYKTYTFVAPSSGTASFEITAASLSNVGTDTYLYLYQTSFNPLSPATNLIASDDDGGVGLFSLITQTLTAGTTYIIVSTTYSSGDVGTFRLQSTIPIFSNTISWYKNASGGTPLATGSIFNPVGVTGSGIPNTSIAGTTNFYVSDEVNSACRKLVTFKIDSLSVGGNVLGGTTVCAGSTRIKLTLSGKTGSVLKWQVSPLSNFSFYTDIANTKDSLIITTAVADTFYRAVVKNGSCLAANSNPANIVVSRPTIAGTVSSDATVCSGINTGTLTLNGNRGDILRWESSTDNFVTNTPIVNTTITQSFSNLTQTTKYRTINQNGGCAILSASPVTITVTSPTVGGTVNTNASVCSGVNTGSVTLSGHVGSILRWESSTDNFVTINTIANTTVTQNYSNLSQSIKYRAVVQNGICEILNSSPVEITVVQLPTLASQTILNPTTCGGNNGSISFKTTNLPNGNYPFSYQTSNPVLTNTVTVNVVSDSFQLSNLSEQSYYNFVVSNLGCSDTVVTDITLYNPFPTNLSDQTICYNTTASLSATCLDGTVKWYGSDGTTLLGSGSPLVTPALMYDSTFNVKCETATCQSGNKQVSVIVLPALISPTAQSDTTINLMGSITLIATGCEPDNILSWYESVSNVLVTMPVIPLDNTQYYAKCQKEEGALTCSSSKSIDVMVNIIPVIVSIVTGDWESPSTWNAGRVPKNGDFVIIDQDHVVTLNGESTIKTIEYRGTGTLKYQSISSKLNTGF